MATCGLCKKELDAHVETLLDIVKGRQSSLKSQMPHNFLFIGDIMVILASDTKFKDDLNVAATQGSVRAVIQCLHCEHINFF